MRWTPSAEDIAAVEAEIAGRTLPLGSLDRYARYYTGVIDIGRPRFIKGTLVPADGNEQPGIHIGEVVTAPLQGGCVAKFDAEGRPLLYLRCTRPRTWTPSAAEIAAMEAQMDKRQLPLGSLDRYARYYAAVAGNESILGRRLQPPGILDQYTRNYAALADDGSILGTLVPAGVNNRAGVHVMERGKLPVVPPEGCRTLLYADFVGGVVKCARPGAWTPSNGQIAELEGLLRRSGNGAYALQNYARHYAGATENGRRIIVGVLVIPKRGDTAGIYIVSEVEFPRLLDGGCSVVTVRYDLSSNEIEAPCNGTT
jgi:hypothetical protein